MVNKEKVKLTEKEIDDCKKLNKLSLEKLIQINDPHVIGPLDKLSSEDHQNEMTNFIKDYQNKNLSEITKQYYDNLTKDKMNKMIDNFMKNTDFSQLKNLSPKDKAKKEIRIISN